MSVVKSKLRNRMSLHTLNSILLVLYGLKLAGDTCYQHKLPSEVLQQFGTTAVYSFKATPSSTAGSSSVTMQLDSEDDEGLLANLWFIIFTVRMQGRSGLSGTGEGTQLMVAVCTTVCVRTVAISGGNHWAASQPSSTATWREMPSAHINIWEMLLVQ